MTLQEKEGEQYFDQVVEIASKYPELGYLREYYPLDCPQAFPRVFFDDEAVLRGPQELLKRSCSAEEGKRHVCIIENITAEWIKALGPAWNLDPRFFVQFMRTEPHSSDWASVVERDDEQTAEGLETSEEMHSIKKDKATRPFWCIRGIQSGTGELWLTSWVRRDYLTQGANGQSLAVKTCISYYETSDTDLFLVDATPSYCDSLKIVTTAHPYGHHTLCATFGGQGGINSIAEALKEWMKEEGNRFVLRTVHKNGGGHRKNWILKSLAASIWQAEYTRLYFLNSNVSYNDIKFPTEDVAASLHTLRLELMLLHQVISDGKDCRCCGDDSCAKEDRLAVQEALQGNTDKSINTPLAEIVGPYPDLDALLKRVEKEQEVVIQSLHFLLAMMTIKENQASIKQSRRGVLLTWLAFIYAPLTFATGVFGMNLAEINESHYTVGVFCIVLVAVVATTIGLYLAYKVWERRWKPKFASGGRLHRLMGRKDREAVKDPAKMV